MLLNLQYYQSATKASQDTDLYVKISKANANYFAEFIYIQFSDSIRSSQFPFSFGYVSIIPIFKNEYTTLNIIANLLASIL